ncbi:MAG TPA: hypothetical protein VIQ05_20870 [Tardiphaga sp.]
MTRAAGITVLTVLATPAFAAGDAFEGAPWWIIAVFYGVSIAVLALLAAGLGFFLQGVLQLRTALVALMILSGVFLGWLATSQGLEKTARILPLFAFTLALAGPPFGLGWFIGLRDATRRSNRKLALNAGSNHG